MTITAQLICVFVFALVKTFVFFHDAAHKTCNGYRINNNFKKTILVMLINKHKLNFKKLRYFKANYINLWIVFLLYPYYLQQTGTSKRF